MTQSPCWLSLIVLAVLTFAVLPGAFVSGALYGRNYGRAFFIGAAIPLGFVNVSLFCYGMLMMIGQMVDGSIEANLFATKIAFAILFASSFISGFVTVAVRWLCLRSAIRDLNVPPRGMHFEPSLRRRVDEASNLAVTDEHGEIPREALVRPR